MDATRPQVSVIMANYNAEAHIAAAVRSVLRQNLASLELILADDGSSDASLARARAAAAGDPRLRVLEGGGRTGPGATRNRALAAAHGRWLAVVDSDDVIHPERLERLVTAGECDGADIVADDLLVFYEHDAHPPHAYLGGRRAAGPTWATAADYLLSDRLFTRGSTLGYLKPLIRRAVASPEALRYDESLRIGEDFELIARLLLSGAHMRIHPELGYFYRKHGGSISHRLDAANLDAMLAAHDRLASLADEDRATQTALRRRRASIETAQAFTELIEALKAKDARAAASAAARRPAALWLLRVPLLDRLRAGPARSASPGPADERRIALLSRRSAADADERTTLVRALEAAGFAVDVIGVSPKPPGPRRARPAASFAIAAPAERREVLRLARRTRRPVAAVLCDAACLAPLTPYALAADAPRIVVAHELTSPSNGSAPPDPAPAESAALTAARELRALSLADAVVTTRPEDDARLRAHPPKAAVLIALSSPGDYRPLIALIEDAAAARAPGGAAPPPSGRSAGGAA